MCQLSLHSRSPIYILCLKKKCYRKNNIYLQFSLWKRCICVWLHLSGGVRGHTAWQEVAVLMKVAFLSPKQVPSTLRHQCILKRNIQSWAWRKICTDVYILFYPSARFCFVFLKFCLFFFLGDVIRILTKSFMCRKSVQVDD